MHCKEQRASVNVFSIEEISCLSEWANGLEADILLRVFSSDPASQRILLLP
jgi:hypothetical protein